MSGNEKLHGVFVVLWILSAHGEKLGDGCGHALLGPESGVLSSKNYPGTYPNHTWCEWRIDVPAGSRLALRFGDLDIEAEDCQADYVRILRGARGGEQDYQAFCGSLKTSTREMNTDTNQLTVQFRSGRHVSGRGFLLSYSTFDHRDLLTCLDRGSHYSAQKYRKYCPAGCRGVAGDVSGDVARGYRHTSVLCKAAVHAGVIQDETGGWVSVETRKGLSHYAASRANGVQSRDGSLSDALFTFVSSECKNQSVLRPVSVSASSWWQRGASDTGRPSNWVPNNSTGSQDPGRDAGGAGGAGGGGSSWVSEQNDALQWLQLDLGEKKRVTGIVVSGSTWLKRECFVRSYRVEVKEKNRWRPYTQNNTTDHTVFEGNQDSVHQTRTSLHAPTVTRYVRIVPLSWHQCIAMRVELQGCAHVRVNVTAQMVLPTKPKPPMPDEEMTHDPLPSHADLVKLVIIIVPTVLSVILLFTGVCVFKMLHKKKTKDPCYGSAEEHKTGCWKQIKQPFTRHQSTEFTISYNSEKDPMQTLDLVTSTMAEYQQPLMMGMGTMSRKGSTFRPIDTEAKDEAVDPATHYDYLHTANQYALPLTNQEPEYATPIIERHAFHKDGFLPDPGSYNVPGAVLSKSPSFRASEAGYRKPGVGAPGAYQTPQTKRTDRAGQNSEGVYDRPKVSPAQRAGAGCSDYQRPLAKPLVLESYSTPRDSVRKSPVSIPPAAIHRPDPEGSSGGT